MSKYGSWEGAWVVYRYSPPRYPPSTPLPRVHPSPTERALPAWSGRTGGAGQTNTCRGLISVDQLSLRLDFSGFQGITEVYNLVVAGNPNDHLYIPGKE